MIHLVKVLGPSVAVATATTVAAVETIPPPTTWSGNDVALVVGAFFTGMTLLLTQLLNLYFTHRTKKAVEVVHDIVNGTNTLLMESGARKDQKIAGLTGGAGDRREADLSEKAASAKRDVMENVERKGKKP